MSENESQSDIASDLNQPAPVARDRSLSVPRERLAGSPACLNCGTELSGPFCYYCGQPDRNFLRFFPVLLREMLSDFIDLDSRFARTMKPLMFRPGRLTRDYLDGRRFRYTPPIRLYLFSSIVFFLVAALLSSNAAREGVETLSANQGQLTEEQAAEAREALKDISPEVREQLNMDLDKVIDNAARRSADAAMSAEESRIDGPQNQWFNIDGIQFNDQPWDAETNPVDLPWVPQWIDDWINGELEDSPAKAEEINRDPDVIIDQIFDLLPATVFVLLPIVALLFKFWYLFAKRFYIEHLIFALHNHAFLFVSLTLLLLGAIAEGRLSEAGIDWAASGVAGAVTALSVWMPLYLLISLRTVYRQNWFLTLFKFGVIGVCYTTLLIGLTVIVAVLSFLLL
ncbi:MAG: DUF3667 domain-containing protein [Xanthomonadales bacterium]|nr:DUF3667 domain-containing protein [Xanthomonadales bacterium]